MDSAAFMVASQPNVGRSDNFCWSTSPADGHRRLESVSNALVYRTCSCAFAESTRCTDFDVFQSCSWACCCGASIRGGKHRDVNPLSLVSNPCALRDAVGASFELLASARTDSSGVERESNSATKYTDPKSVISSACVIEAGST